MKAIQSFPAICDVKIFKHQKKLIKLSNVGGNDKYLEKMENLENFVIHFHN